MKYIELVFIQLIIKCKDLENYIDYFLESREKSGDLTEFLMTKAREIFNIEVLDE